MTQAKQGDTVQIHYTGRLRNGTVFDSSEGREPLSFVLGSGMVIPGFDKGVTGMTVGERRSIEIPYLEAYGPRHPELALQVPRSDLPPDLQPEVGMQLQLMQPDGQMVVVTIVDVSPETLTLDANHPLAGEDLMFDLQLVSVA
ncbi:MAG TPA: peptidylprolyl isomerase, partial [Oscillatoriaceae cyanobacterium]